MSKQEKCPVRDFNKFEDGTYSKVLYSGDRYYDQSFVKLHPDYVAIASNSPGGYDTALVQSKLHGTMVFGPFSVLTALQNIRIGPQSCINPMNESYIPSTIYTPIPTLWPMPPLKLDFRKVIEPVKNNVQPRSNVSSAAPASPALQQIGGPLFGSWGNTMPTLPIPTNNLVSGTQNQFTIQGENTVDTENPVEAPPQTSGFGMPFSGCFRTSSKYGEMNSFRRNASGAVRPHMGVDYACPPNTPILAVADGTVVSALEKQIEGKYIKINHTVNNESYTSMYMHLNSFSVAAGQQVKRGDVIGYSGNTGTTTGPHLHFGMMRGSSFIDPTTVLPGC